MQPNPGLLFAAKPSPSFLFVKLKKNAGRSPVWKEKAGKTFRLRQKMREKAAEDTRIMKDWIILRGGGDLATGAVQCLWRAGFKPLILEAPEPLAIRREVALSEAVYEGLWGVEDLTAE